MWIVDTLSRIVHIGTAITLVGGSVFTLFVLMPSARQLSDEAHDQLAAAVGSRWKRFVHFGILLFLISGFYNYWRAIPLHRGDGLYHALIGTKMMLALGVFFLAAALVGRSAKLEKIRRNRSTWLTVLVLLAATIVILSGYVKVRPLPLSLKRCPTPFWSTGQVVYSDFRGMRAGEISHFPKKVSDTFYARG